MSNQDNPFGGSPGAGNYQMSYQTSRGNADAPGATPGAHNQSPAANPANAGAEIGKDISTAQFVEEVIEASKTMPVIIDFWAPWCGPCKQLTPILENVARQFAGQIKLVKMNTEQYPEVAGQMGIQSIPAVVTFVGGKPVDAFMGVKPESEVRSFFEKHGGPAKASSDEVLAKGRELIAASDLTGAMGLLANFLQTDPENAAALALLGSVYLNNGDIERAENILASIDQSDHGKPDVATLKSAIELARQADELGDVEELARTVAANPSDMQAKFDLSLAYNTRGDRELAADLLLEIIKLNRNWDDDAARKQLVKYFEAWGEADEATKLARRKLSSVLFS